MVRTSWRAVLRATARVVALAHAAVAEAPVGAPAPEPRRVLSFHIHHGRGADGRIDRVLIDRRGGWRLGALTTLGVDGASDHRPLLAAVAPRPQTGPKPDPPPGE